MSTPAEKRFYNSKAWRAVREQAMSRDNGLCQICREHGEVKAAKEVDHIIPIKERPELKLRLDNLQSLCHRCHVWKTKSDLADTPRICIHGMIESACQECKDS